MKEEKMVAPALPYRPDTVLSADILKILAMTIMLIDHIGAFLIERSDPMYWPLRSIGRLAFPIFCFLIAEGAHYTHSMPKYMARLAAFALISTPPYNLVHGSEWYSPDNVNVFFTLFLGYCCIAAYERFRDDRKRLLLSLSGLLIVSLLLHADYGIRGMALILVLHLVREERILQGVLGCCILNEGAATIPAFVLTGLYNGERGFIKGKILKYLFYAFYPLHLLILYFLKMYCFGS